MYKSSSVYKWKVDFDGQVMDFFTGVSVIVDLGVIFSLEATGWS